MTRSLAVARTAVFGALAGLLLMCLATPQSGAASVKATASSVEFVSLQGEGSWGVSQQMVPWQNELVTAPSFVNLNYISRGSFLARSDLADKSIDYAISGLPFTKEQLAGVKVGAGAFISAPVAVASLATLVEPTTSFLATGGFPGFVASKQICDPGDPDTWPSGVTEGQGCFVNTAYNGPIRIPNRNLAAMLLSNNDGSQPALTAWNNRGILEAFGLNADTDSLKNISGQPTLGPALAGRSDPDEITYFLQKFTSTVAPDLWTDLAQQRGWLPIRELMPGQPGIQRDGAEQQVEQLAQSGCGVGISACLGQGAIAPAPASMLGVFKKFLLSAPPSYPPQKVEFAEAQNANGDWVAPSPESIDKAVEAGGAQPLYALTNKVPDAYPLVWVDRLYAPAHGLSREKTEGLATLIRYLATSGQEKAAGVGEGRLSQPLIAEALAAADTLVTSNCAAAGGAVVTSDDPGPLAPATATAMTAIGPMLHCSAPVPTTTTTTALTPTTPFVSPNNNGGGNNNSGGGSSGGTGGSSGGTTGTTAPPLDVPVAQQPAPGPTTPSSQKDAPPLLIADTLPLPLPAGASGTDRLATFLLGVALYLALRKPVGRFITRMRA